MAINWEDPSLYASGAGTALGLLGNIFGVLQQRGYYNDLQGIAQRQQRAAQAQQQQAIEFARQREAQIQALSGKPLDIQAYMAPMQEAQINALRREFLANSGRNSLPPDLAQRMFQTEQLPKFILEQWRVAAELAQADRQRQLSALGYMPSVQLQGGNLNPGGEGVLGAASRFGGLPQLGGDVSSFANYLRYNQLRNDQMTAQRDAASRTDTLLRQLQGYGGGTNPVNIEGILPLTGTSAYDPHRDRLGTKGIADPTMKEYGPSAVYDQGLT